MVLICVASVAQIHHHVSPGESCPVIADFLLAHAGGGDACPGHSHACTPGSECGQELKGMVGVASQMPHCPVIMLDGLPAVQPEPVLAQAAMKVEKPRETGAAALPAGVPARGVSRRGPPAIG